VHPRINVDNFSAIVFATDYGFEAAAFVFGNTGIAFAMKIYLEGQCTDDRLQLS